MRTVIEAAVVSETIDAASTIYPRLWDAFEALKWTLSHVPEWGELIDDMHWLYKQNGDKKRQVPSIVVLYTFTIDEVEIKFVLVKIPTI